MLQNSHCYCYCHGYWLIVIVLRLLALHMLYVLLMNSDWLTIIFSESSENFLLGLNVRKFKTKFIHKQSAGAERFSKTKTCALESTQSYLFTVQ